MQELREYQKEAVDHMIRQHKVVLADDPGLGKTRTALDSAIKLAGMEQIRILVVGTNISLGTWKHEAKKWFGFESMYYTGKTTPAKRKKLWQQYQEDKPELLLTTYAMVKEIVKLRADWPVVIADEYHNAGLVNVKSKTYKEFKKLRSRFLFLLTGTPIKRGPQDLFGPLHLVSPYRFSSYWKFINQHCIVIPDTFGYTIEPRPRAPKEFRELISPYVIRRTKKEVLTELPAIQRQPIYLQLSAEQEKAYAALAEKDLLILPNKEVVACPNKATTLIRLRQLLTAPRLLGLPDEGTALSALSELAEDVFGSGRPIAVCTPFRAAVDMIAEVLKPYTTELYKIHGEMKTPAKAVAEAFQNSKNPARGIIYTIASGQSFDAYAASDLFFVGAEWSATLNRQAEGRLHRMGQENKVNVYYLLYENTVDDAIIERLDENTMAEGWILNTEYMYSLIKQAKEGKQ